MYEEAIFDLETQKFFDDIGEFDATKLGASVVSIYKRTLDKDFNEIEGNMFSFWEDDLTGLWKIFKNVDRLIGFNSIKFDTAVLKPYADFDLTILPHFDVLEHVRIANGKRVSLNSIAGETLGKGKVDDPKNAIIYWRKKDKESLKLLQRYCEEDVILTKEIYDYGLKNKKLKFKDYWNTVREIDVDFSYTDEEIQKKEKPQEEQVSLF